MPPEVPSKGDLLLLEEAASEVTTACPWVSATGSERELSALAVRGWVVFTGTLFTITPTGILVLSRHDPALARRALTGLRRERDQGAVMPWHVA